LGGAEKGSVYRAGAVGPKYEVISVSDGAGPKRGGTFAMATEVYTTKRKVKKKDTSCRTADKKRHLLWCRKREPGIDRKEVVTNLSSPWQLGKDRPDSKRERYPWGGHDRG